MPTKHNNQYQLICQEKELKTQLGETSIVLDREHLIQKKKKKKKRYLVVYTEGESNPCLKQPSFWKKWKARMITATLSV